MSVGNYSTGGTTVTEHERCVVAGSLFEGVGGAAAVVLGILGLCGIYPNYMLAISVIAVGAGLLIQGGSVMARCAHLASEAGCDASESDGTAAEFMGGVAAVVLGILALVHIHPIILPAIAAIVVGGAILLGCSAAAHVNALYRRHAFAPTTASGMPTEPPAFLHGRFLHGGLMAGRGAQVLVGIAAVVLGILGLVLESADLSRTLLLVAFLTVGAGMLLCSAAIRGHILTTFRHA